jgi:hypothetical protein
MNDFDNEDEDSCIGFEPRTRVIPLSSILPLKALPPGIKQSKKYKQVAASVSAIGLVECPVVISNPIAENSYYLLDGLMRIEVIKDLGWKEVECLISKDDEAFTYNKRISRLAAVQENRMVVRAIERGVPEEKLARALNLDVSSIRRRRDLLQGICPETVELLADKPCPMMTFDFLRRMKPMRQIEAAELMIGQRNYLSPFVRAILAATPPDQLAHRRRNRTNDDISREQIARLERELYTAQQRTRYVEETYGEDNLQLMIAKSYLVKLLKKPVIFKWLQDHQPEYLAEFQDITEINSLNANADNAEA